MAAQNETVRALQDGSRGLLYPSEADKPLKVVSWPAAEGVCEDVVRRQCGLDSKTPIETKPVDEFFAPVTTLQDWYGDAEKQTAARFQELERLVRERLSNAQLFRWGDTTAHLLLLGKDASGGVAGLHTQVVET